MKRLAIMLLCTVLLCGCMAVDTPVTEPTVPATQARETLSTETLPAETMAPETQPAATEPAGAETVVSVPYTTALHAAVPIFGGPGYDEMPPRIVGEDGVYTIVEEVTDSEGNLWGRLKSGAGWVDLSAVDLSVPVTAAFADEALLRSGNYHIYTGDTSDYVTQIAFRAREKVTDVRLSALEPDWERGDGYTEERPLYILPALEPGMPLVAELTYWGDMTAYGLSFTDADGAVRHYAVTISGRNGMLLMQEYIPAQ